MNQATFERSEESLVSGANGSRRFGFKTGLLMLLILTPLFITACGEKKGDPNAKKMMVLGIDGLDPTTLTRLMDEGKLPTFQRLRQMGDMRNLTTSIPPQSPVAWSNFITGMNPGGHGIFDFVHRDEKTDPPAPKFSASEVLPPSFALSLGDYYLPLLGGGEVNSRHGRAFWEILGDHNIPASVYKIPVNYPPSKSIGETFSGMGTPDLLGTQGTSYYFTDNPPQDAAEAAGVKIVNVLVDDNKVTTAIEGMPDPLLNPEAQAKNPPVLVPFTVHLDPERQVAKIEIEGTDIILQVGEWSDWTPIDLKIMRLFGMDSIPIIAVTGICRFYLKEITPDFKLYMSPINLDPSVPGSLSEPSDASVKLYEALDDYYYTQNMPEDFLALGSEVLSAEDFIQQSNLVVGERRRMFEHALSKFESGLLFFYVGSVDLNQHMFFRTADERHPAYTEELGKKHKNRIEDLYLEADEFLAKAMEFVDDDTLLIVMSDHGFAPFYRQFQLTNWLRDEGYLAVKEEPTEDGEGVTTSIDWSKTKAYSMGINGLYLNLKDREACGIVNRGKEAEQLLAEIKFKLLKIRDEDPRFKDNPVVVHHVYNTKEIYQGEHVDEAPDLIVGYNRGYRSADDAGLCTVTDKPVLTDRNEWWSGDHCMSHTLVPGTLMSNRKLGKNDPALFDLAPTILEHYGITPPEHMVGSTVY